MIVDKCRNLEELKELYKLCDNERLARLENILNLPTHCCFYDNKNKLVGLIYLEDEDGKVMLSGFGRRKSYDLIIEAIQHILWCNPELDIYSRTTKLSARYALRKAGFKKLDDELYVRKAVA